MSKAKQELAVVKEPNIIHLPEGLSLEDLIKDSGAGVDTMTSGDVALPYLYILQALSPIVNPAASQYIEGAQASMLYNNVSQELYDGRKEGLIVVPCYYERKYVEW